MIDYRSYYNFFKNLPKILLWVNTTIGMLLGFVLVPEFAVVGFIIGILGGIIIGSISYLFTAVLISPVVIITDSRLEQQEQ